MDSKQIYVKVTNEKENHNGFQYIDGLNILQEPFNNNPNDSCCAGGLYFTTLEHINKFYEYGINLRVVELPLNDPEFKMIKDRTGDKWRANKIIFKEKYSLLDIETYQKFNLNILDNTYFIDNASENGHVNVLDWWKSSGFDLEYSNDAIDYASENGHVNVLDW